MFNWTREVMLYKDPKVAAAGIKVCTGMKWSAMKELGKGDK